MKHSLYIILLVCCSALFSCRKTIDLYPQSNLNTGTYYSNLEELKAGLTGAYNGLQRSLFNEWQLTELRSDNAKQGQPGSTASTNRDLSDLDMFIPSTSHQGIYNYWANTYNNIRNANIVLLNLGVAYDPATVYLQVNGKKNHIEHYHESPALVLSLAGHLTYRGMVVHQRR